MENRRGSEIFLGVVGVTTLIVAIIGATFAYFSANASSNNEAIAVQSTTVELGFKDDAPTGLKTNMIPSTFDIAYFAAFNETWINKGTFADGSSGKGKCLDDLSREICSTYEFWIGNPSDSTPMEIVGQINVVVNEFGNLKYAIYDEAGTKKEEGVFPESGAVELDNLAQTLTYNENVASKEGVTFNSEDPTTYNPLLDMSDAANAGKETNVRHYKMLIWINETGSNQKEEDAGKMFTAGISFSTGGDSGGVTGMIAVADDAS